MLSKPDFRNWLKGFIAEESPLGDLARFVSNDAYLQSDGLSYGFSRIVHYMAGERADAGALLDAQDAYDAYLLEVHGVPSSEVGILT